MGIMANFSFGKWYKDNAERLKAKKKNLYDTDAQYRERALATSKKHRDAKRKPQPDGYTFTFDQAAGIIGVSTGTLREWKKKKYYPEPLRHNSRMWFTENQILLLRKLNEFFTEQGIRMGATKRGMLEDKVNWIISNWNQ